MFPFIYHRNSDDCQINESGIWTRRGVQFGAICPRCGGVLPGKYWPKQPGLRAYQMSAGPCCCRRGGGSSSISSSSPSSSFLSSSSSSPLSSFIPSESSEGYLVAECNTCIDGKVNAVYNVTFTGITGSGSLLQPCADLNRTYACAVDLLGIGGDPHACRWKSAYYFFYDMSPSIIYTRATFAIFIDQLVVELGFPVWSTWTNDWLAGGYGCAYYHVNLSLDPHDCLNFNRILPYSGYMGSTPPCNFTGSTAQV